MDDLEL